ncbi:AbiJ-NTD4 domain-containing protein [Pseudomonas veronii]
MSDDMNHLSFSQRMGQVPAVKVAQVDSIDKALKNSLWNVLTLKCFSGYYAKERVYPDRLRTSNFKDFAEKLYSDFYKAPVDTIPSAWSSLKTTMKESYFKMSWHQTYSFIEFIVKMNYNGTKQTLIDEFNIVLTRENSAYRFAAEKLIQITSKNEIEEIERAIANSDQYAGVRTHIQTSLGFLTDKLNPDYRNSIKESISAVESLAKKLVGDDKATLGQALKVLEKHHNLHPSLKTAFSALYGYTNDASGIRHSLMDNESALTQADARFMLICCSAFINFAIDSTKS